MKIILIGNYERDEQESMQRFAAMLLKGFSGAGIDCNIWQPVVFFGTPFKNTNTGIGKWMGYADKWLLFPLLLRLRLLLKKNKYRYSHFHICDHSNAPYLAYLPEQRTVITCHDVIAIRASLGHQDEYVQVSKAGIILQKWILKYLSGAKKLAAVSELTMQQLSELLPAGITRDQNWHIVHNAFNEVFAYMPAEEATVLLNKVSVNIKAPFILHVGSALERKNRKLLLEMVAALGTKWNGYICYAGKEIDPALAAVSKSLGLNNRVISVVNPDHKTLLALYSHCQAFIFPSFSEGFGWPVIEAQGCGAPVIASNRPPMPEISGGAALHKDPQDVAGFTTAFIQLQDEHFRNDLVQKGFTNTQRFTLENMIKKYLSLHNL